MVKERQGPADDVRACPKPEKRPKSSCGRSKKEYARIYGSEERVLFVKSLPCIYPKCWRPSDNHHIESGGVGRKADYTKIVPLCRAHHRGIHVWGQKTWARFTGIDLDKAARDTETAWLQHTTNKGER